MTNEEELDEIRKVATASSANFTEQLAVTGTLATKAPQLLRQLEACLGDLKKIALLFPREENPRLFEAREVIQKVLKIVIERVGYDPRPPAISGRTTRGYDDIYEGES